MPRLPTFLWSMDYFNAIYIEQTVLGVGFHNLMNNLKHSIFRVKTFQLLLSMKSQLNMNSKGPQGFISKKKQLKEFKCLIITDSTLQLKFAPFMHFNCSFNWSSLIIGSDKLSFFQ